jgi:uncharacterized OB-fold protein
MMDYGTSITYDPVPANAIQAEQAGEGRFLGLACPICGRVYIGGKGSCWSPSSSPRTTVDLPQSGVLITTRSSPRSSTPVRPRPSRSPGHVLLDGTDVVMPYQPLIRCPTRCASDCFPRCGHRRPNGRPGRACRLDADR